MRRTTALLRVLRSGRNASGLRRSPRAIAFLLAGIALLTAAAPASGEPDLRTRLSTGSPPFTWEAEGRGVAFGGCDDTATTCHEVLVELVEGGDLVAQAEAADSTVEDLDLSLRRSDADGKPGKVVEQLENCRAYEKVRAEGIAPGFYLVRVRYATGAGTHRGTIALLADGAPAPPFPYETIEHRGVLGTSTRAFSWSGTASGSDYCTSESGTTDADNTLVRLDEPGDLRLRVQSSDAAAPARLEFYVNRSDETGFQGRYLAGAVAGPDPIRLPNLAAGWVRVTVTPTAAAGAHYAADLSLAPRPVPPPAGPEAAGPGATPTPSGAPASAPPDRDAPARPGGREGAAPPRDARGGPRVRIRRPRASGRVRRLTGSAGGGAGIARVDVALVHAGRPCRQADAGGRLRRLARCSRPTLFVAARGTSRWSFALPGRMPSGRYVAYARAVDASGTVGPVTRRTVRIGRRPARLEARRGKVGR